MIVFGKYELLTLLARGGVADIWLARQRGLGGFEKLVVVKRLNKRLQREQEYVDMFLDEARINARLQHSNVLAVYELGEVDGTYFLSMEYVEGMALGVLAKKAIARLSDLPIPIACGLLIQAAHGVHYAHEAVGSDGAPLLVVHRDLSPLNLLVSFDGILKVVDFGVAKAQGRVTRTKTGIIKGTPTYMSPEQCSGGEVDRRSDVFGLGILLWELLSGRRLFKRPTVEETYDAIVKGRIPPPSTYRLELPTSLDGVVSRALARRPEDRFPTAAAFASELETALHREGLRAEALDVRAFLAAHFDAERAEQEALLARVRQRDPALGSEDPLFQSADHGLDTGELHPAIAPPFSDGDTHRDAVTPIHEEPTAEAIRVELGPAAQLLPASTLPGKRAGAEPAPVASRFNWAIVLWILSALGIALALGVLAGRHRG